MKNIHDVSIVVSNYNSSNLLNGALESIVSTAEDLSFNVVVVDDASTDGGLTLVDDKYKNDRRLLFVQNKENIGISALNIILQHCGKYILTLDADARLEPGALRALIDFMETHPEAGGATANLRNRDGSVQLYYRRLMTPKLYFFTTLTGRFIDKCFLRLRHFKYYHYDNLNVDSTPELEQPPIACLILRRAIFDDYIMDPHLYLLFIDVDLCKRIYDRGYKIYLVTNALVRHLKSASFVKRENAWRRREYYSGLNLYFKKHYRRWFPVLWIMSRLDCALRIVVTNMLGRDILH